VSDERKLVTVLFADIVGSTALTTSHQPEVVREVLQAVFASLSEVIRGHGGTVEKFIGDEIMAVFGAPVAHEDDADRAVRASLAMRARIAEHNARSPLAVELRIGVNTGEVIAATDARNEFMVTGEPVVAAARLRAAADPGQTLVGALTRRLTEPGVRYGRRRMVRAKGLGRLEASVVEGLASALPQAARGVQGLHAPMIGRDTELATLRELHRRAAAEGRALLVTVFAPPGAGKSRLAQEFSDALAPGTVLRGRCLSYGQSITLWPLQELLRQDASITLEDTREAAERKLRAAVVAAFAAIDEESEGVALRLAVLLGIREPAEALPGLVGAPLQQELRWGLGRFLERRAQSAAPLTVVLEDIHWAEPALLELIEHLAQTVRAPLLVLCLARPDLREARPEWGAHAAASMLDLDPLSDAESGRLIHSLLRVEDLPVALRQRIQERAQGNPLYVEEFLRVLIDAGQIQRRGRHWVAKPGAASLAVPETIHGLIAARLDRLAPEPRRTLHAASVIGTAFWLDALAGLGLAEERAAGDLREAERRDLVLGLAERGPAGGEGYAFKHVLIRDVSYGSVNKVDRLQYHDQFGRWLEEIAGERRTEYTEVVAHHAEQAFLLAHALARGEAPELGRRAFDLLHVLIQRARDNADHAGVLGLCERALAVGRAAALPDADLARASAIVALTEHFLATSPETARRLETSIDELRAAAPSEPLMTMLISLADAIAVSDVTRAAALFDEALEVARALCEPELVLRAMVAPARVSLMTGQQVSGQHTLEAALAYMRENRLGWTPNGPLEGLAEIAMLHGRFSDARALHDEAEALLRQTSRSGPIARLPIEWRVYLATRYGNYPEAMLLAERYLASGLAQGEAFWIAWVKQDLGDCLYELGQVERALAVHTELFEVVRGLTAAPSWLPEVRWRLARDLLALGRVGAAVAQAEQACAETAPDDLFSQATTRAALAEARAAQGRRAEAEALFRESIAMLKPLGYDYNTADVRVRFAVFLIAQGRRQEARVHLEAARDFYSDPLAIHKREAIEALLRQCDDALSTPAEATMRADR